MVDEAADELQPLHSGGLHLQTAIRVFMRNMKFKIHIVRIICILYAYYMRIICVLCVNYSMYRYYAYFIPPVCIVYILHAFSA